MRFNTPEGVEGFSSPVADAILDAVRELVSIPRRVLRGFRGQENVTFPVDYNADDLAFQYPGGC